MAQIALNAISKSSERFLLLVQIFKNPVDFRLKMRQRSHGLGAPFGGIAVRIGPAQDSGFEQGL